MSSTKAKGHSISFRPETLYFELEAHGLKQSPQLNVSQVVCHFARLGLAGELGAHPLSQLIAELRRLGGDPEQALRHAIRAMENPEIAALG